MLDLGELAARVVVDDRKFGPGLNATHRRFGIFGSRIQSDASAAGSKAGSNLGGSFTREANKATSHFSLAPVMATVGKFGAAGVAALGAVGGAGVAMGLQVAAGNENADIAFTTMLGSGKKAKVFLDDLKKFAAATPFDFPGLQTAASSLISAGVNAKNVIPIMTSLGNATSGMGTGAEGVQRATVALQQMNAAGRITAEDLNQLRDAGIPVYDLLAKATGKSKKEIAALAQTGKLGKKELTQMMDALASGKGLERFNGLMEKQSASLNGMWSTMKDTLGQGLATAIQPVIPLLKEGMGGAAAFAGRVLARLPGIITPIVDAIQLFRKSDAWAGIKEQAGDVFSAIRRGIGRLPELFETVRNFDWAPLTAAFGRLKDAFSGMGPAVSSASADLPSLAPIVNRVADAMKFLADHADLVAKALPFLIAGFAAYKAAQAANNVVGKDSLIGFGLQLASTVSLTIANFALAKSLKASSAATEETLVAENASVLTRARSAVATVAVTVAQKAARVGAAAWTAVQWLLNAALNANPIGLVVLAIAALAAGFIYAYKHSDKFRVLVGKVIGWFKKEVPKALEDAKDKILGAWDAITGGFSRAVAWVKGAWKKNWMTIVAVLLGPVGIAALAIYKHWDDIKAKFSAAKDWVKGAWKKAWGATSGAMSGAVDAGRRSADDHLTRLRDRFTSAKDWVKGAWKKAWAAASPAISGAVSDGRAAADGHLSRMRDRFTAAKDWVKGAWKKAWAVAGPTISNAVDAGRRAADGHLTTLRGRFSAARDWVAGGFKKAWAVVKKVLSDPVDAARDAITGIFGTDNNSGLRGRFWKTVDALGKIWDRLKAKMKSPISSVINIINTGLIGAYNWVIDKLHLPASLRAKNIAIKGFRTGGSTGSGVSDDEVAGITHANEHVITADEVRGAGGHGRIERLRAFMRAGSLPEFLAGGRVMWPVPGHKTGTYPGHTGVDINRGSGSQDYGDPIRAAQGGRVVAGRGYGLGIFINTDSGYKTIYGHASVRYVHPGDRVKTGQLIGRVGSTGNSTGPHLHFEVRPGGTTAAALRFLRNAAGNPGVDAGSGEGATEVAVKAGWLGAFANPAAFLKDRASKAMDAAGLSKLGSSGWAGALKAVPGRLMNGILDKVRGFAASTWHTIKTIGSELLGAGIRAPLLTLGRNRNAVKNAAKAYGWDKGSQWASLYQLVNHESSFKNTAQNPGSTAYGLFQFLNSTWRGVGGHKTSDPDLQSLYGLRYVKQAYGNPVNAYSKWLSRSPHWYGDGTNYATAGVRGVAERGPELVVNPGLRRFSGGEKVLNARQTAEFSGGDRPYVGSLTLVSSGNVNADLAEVGFKIRTISRGGVHA